MVFKNWELISILVSCAGGFNQHAYDSPPMGSAALAMQTIDRLADQLNPDPNAASTGEVPQRPQMAGSTILFTEAGIEVGAVTVVAPGPGARFRMRTLDDGFAVVTWLCITNAAAAESQLAWEDDGDVVVGGVTPLAAVPSGQMLAVPRNCLQIAITERRLRSQWLNSII